MDICCHFYITHILNDVIAVAINIHAGILAQGCVEFGIPEQPIGVFFWGSPYSDVDGGTSCSKRRGKILGKLGP